MIDSFARAGWNIPIPQASMFAWSPIPEPFRHLGSVEFAKRLMTEAQVAVAPGVGFGEEGKAMSASPWSKMNNASARPRAASRR